MTFSRLFAFEKGHSGGERERRFVELVLELWIWREATAPGSSSTKLQLRVSLPLKNGAYIDASSLSALTNRYSNKSKVSKIYQPEFLTDICDQIEFSN